MKKLRMCSKDRGEGLLLERNIWNDLTIGNTAFKEP
jgi:hypothetical protein